MNYLILGALLTSCFLQGVIFQIDSLEHINGFINQENPLILFDLQDTLVRSVYSSMEVELKKLLKTHLKPLIGHKMRVKWLFSRPMEQCAGEIIESFEKQGLLVGILTQNHKLEISHIFYQLALANIQLPVIWDTYPKLVLEGSQSRAIAERGIISCGANTKGEALSLFLHKTELTPSHVVFIDNSLACLKSVETVLTEEFNIPFTGLWYVNKKQHKSIGKEDIKTLKSLDILEHCNECIPNGIIRDL